MYFLLSGEGITDLGTGTSSTGICEGSDYIVGPMTVIVEQVVEKRHSYSLLDKDTRCCGYVTKRCLADRAKALKAAPKKLRLPGLKTQKETRYFFNNARVLSRLAKAKGTEIHDDVVAVLFRDSDGTASAGRGLWEDKRQSMLDGFDEEGFEKGVPMVPKPKSEAWVICALKRNPYQGCEELEERSGNDASPKSLKKELKAILGEEATADLLCRKLRDGDIDIDRIKMPSFKAFRERMEAAISEQ